MHPDDNHGAAYVIHPHSLEALVVLDKQCSMRESLPDKRDEQQLTPSVKATQWARGFQKGCCIKHAVASLLFDLRFVVNSRRRDMRVHWQLLGLNHAHQLIYGASAASPKVFFFLPSPSRPHQAQPICHIFWQNFQTARGVSH